MCLFVDRPPTPKKKLDPEGEKGDQTGKKKKMNLKWDDDADNFHKIEEMRPIGSSEIEEFNKHYNDDLKARADKEKEAAVKFEKKQLAMAAKAADSTGGPIITPKGPTVLQRGAFKRGEKVEKEDKDTEAKKEAASNNQKNGGETNDGESTGKSNTTDGKNKKAQPKTNEDGAQKPKKQKNNNTANNNPNQPQQQRQQQNNQMPKPQTGFSQPIDLQGLLSGQTNQNLNMSLNQNLNQHPNQNPNQKRNNQKAKGQPQPQMPMMMHNNDFDGHFMGHPQYDPAFQAFQMSQFNQPMYHKGTYQQEELYMMPQPTMPNMYEMYNPNYQMHQFPGQQQFYQQQMMGPPGYFKQPNMSPQNMQHGMPPKMSHDQGVLGEQLLKQMLNIDSRPQQNMRPMAPNQQQQQQQIPPQQQQQKKQPQNQPRRPIGQPTQQANQQPDQPANGQQPN